MSKIKSQISNAKRQKSKVLVKMGRSKDKTKKTNAESLKSNYKSQNWKDECHKSNFFSLKLKFYNIKFKIKKSNGTNLMCIV